MITTPHYGESRNELGQEFRKLALLVPTIPKDECLSELEFIEIVIAYIRQLQQLLSRDQWNESMSKLASTATDSSVSYKNVPVPSPRLQNNEAPSTNHRSPLASINLDNTHLC